MIWLEGQMTQTIREVYSLQQIITLDGGPGVV